MENSIFANRILNNFHELKVIRLGFSPINACVLPNNLLAVVSDTSKKIVLFDQDFNEVKTISKINNKSFESFGITTNNKDKIYIADLMYNQVISTDLDFNYVKSYEYEKPPGMLPHEIFYYNDNVYVCECGGGNIIKLSSELEYIQKFPIGYDVARIKILDGTACIQCWEGTTGLNFHNIETFEFKRKITTGKTVFGIFDSMFWLIDPLRGATCFNSNGEFIKTITTKRENHKEFLDLFNNNYEGNLLNFNGRIIVILYNTGRILVI